MGSLNTKMIAFSFQTFCCCCCSLLISVNGETYKLAIKRLMKIRTHHVVQKHLTATVTDKKLINNCAIFVSLHLLVFGCLFVLKTFYQN